MWSWLARRRDAVEGPAGSVLLCGCGVTTSLRGLSGGAGRRVLLCAACGTVLLDERRETELASRDVGLRHTSHTRWL